MNASQYCVDAACACLAYGLLHYNFVRIHQSLRVTPATVAKVTERLWDAADMVKVLEV